MVVSSNFNYNNFEFMQTYTWADEASYGATDCGFDSLPFEEIKYWIFSFRRFAKEAKARRWVPLFNT